MFHKSLRHVSSSLSSKQQPHRFTLLITVQQRHFGNSVSSTHLQQQQQQQQKGEGYKPSVTVFGGSGFVGKHLLPLLAPHCSSITVGCRFPAECNMYIQEEAIVDAHMAKVVAQEVNIKDNVRVEQLVAGSDIVINMVGMTFESDNNYVETFTDGSRNIFHAARRMQVPRAIHLSMLGAEPDHDSRWIDYVYRGEDMAYASYPDVTILRSSLIFGKGARMFDAIRSFSRLVPALPLPTSTSGVYQPVYVGDVAEAITRCAKDDATEGQIYELGGPHIYDFKSMIKTVVGNRKPILPVPTSFWDLTIGVTQFLPNPTFTRDQIPLLNTSMVVTGEQELRSFKDLGIVPRSLDEFYGNQ